MEELKNVLKKPEQIFINLLVLLVFISLIGSFRLLVAVTVVIVLYTLIVERGNLIKTFSHFAFVLPFMVFILLPMAFSWIFKLENYHWQLYLGILLKIMSSAMILSLAMSRYSIAFILDGVMHLGLPAVMNRILALTFRYFHMVSQDVKIGNMALVARGLKERGAYSSLSIIGEWIGGFFLKSSDHSETISMAMKSRGYSGEIPNSQNVFKNKYILFNTCALILFFVAIVLLESRL